MVSSAVLLATILPATSEIATWCGTLPTGIRATSWSVRLSITAMSAEARLGTYAYGSAASSAATGLAAAAAARVATATNRVR